MLGACEVTLVDLTNLYSSLARGGQYAQCSWLRDHKEPKRRSLLSEEVCFLISEILLDLKRPDLPTSWEFTADLPRVAWKTGTSYGRKDAWTVGYNPKYTVGIWAGNFSGEGSIDIVGAEIAAPLMFDIFNEISSETEAGWFEMPSGIETRRVCAVSGKLPGEHCRETVLEHFIAEKSPTATCDIHQMILVDNKTGYRLCRFCAHGADYSEVTREQWPAKLASWLNESGRFDPVPAHNPDCPGHIVADNPVITSPEKDAVFVLQDGVPSEYQEILLEASAQGGCRELHWFVDRKLYETCQPGARVFYTPSKGKHDVICLDDQGRSQTVTFEVR